MDDRGGAASGLGQPIVSVIVPTRNEALHLESCLDSILHALFAIEKWEVLVVDGISSDGTRDIVRRFSVGHPGVRLVDNFDHTTPAAFNRGIAEARAPVIAIVSGHSTVEHDFFTAGLEALGNGTADVVGGPVATVPGGHGPLAKVLALLVSHPFGVGNSKFRVSCQRGYVDAVPFALFRREVFAEVGLFDEGLPRNQDTEFFGRVARAGLRVLLEPNVKSTYIARGTLGGLLRQGFSNAYWNVRVWRANPAAFRLRHAIPGAFVTTTVLGGLAAFVWPSARTAVALLLALYFVAAMAAASHIAFRSRNVLALAMPVFFFMYHLTYGAGSIAGLRWLLSPRPPV